MSRCRRFTTYVHTTLMFHFRRLTSSTGDPATFPSSSCFFLGRLAGLCGGIPDSVPRRRSSDERIDSPRRSYPPKRLPREPQQVRHDLGRRRRHSGTWVIYKLPGSSAVEPVTGSSVPWVKAPGTTSLPH